VQSAHMITTDFQMLSQPLEGGILLMDRTERKLKLVRSLGELLPQHQYTTEYGNVLERTTKHKAVLAGSIELDVTTDEADFDEHLRQLALDSHSRPTVHTKMAAYNAVSMKQLPAGDEASSLSTTSSLTAETAGHARGDASTSAALHNGSMLAHANGEEAAERLEEGEALQRVAALVQRMAEMEEWFRGVKAEAERERKMREQAVTRLGLMQERVDRATNELTELRRENVDLRVRLEELSVAQEEIKDLGASGSSRPALVGQATLRSSFDKSLTGSIANNLGLKNL